MNAKKFAALIEKRDAAARQVVRSVKRWEKLTQQVRRAERSLDKDFVLRAEETATIPGMVDLNELARVSFAKQPTL